MGGQWAIPGFEQRGTHGRWPSVVASCLQIATRCFESEPYSRETPYEKRTAWPDKAAARLRMVCLKTAGTLGRRAPRVGGQIPMIRSIRLFF